MLLIVGATADIALIAIGAWFFYHWSDSLADLLNKDTAEKKQARWVLIPLLIIVLGAGLAFLAIQPARAEERNSSIVRKWVYGTNLGLSVLLLFVVLVVANVALGWRLPNKLDTTESGFYSLSNTTKDFLAHLDQPVTAYAILPEGGDRLAEDIRRLLLSCEDAAGGQFKVQFINQTLNNSKYRALVSKYPILETNEGPQGGSYGVLLTVGADEKRHSFMREDEFALRDPTTPRGSQPSISFIGESRLMRELQFLAENQQKAVVYFTQSSGELEIEGGQQENAGPSGSATRLKAYLERNFLDVRPLTFDPVNPKVPDDATVVVVAEPRSPLSEPMANAIKQYMMQPRADNKKGKLIVLSSGQFGPDGKVLRTGLENVLADFNVRISNQVILGLETRELDSLTSVVFFAPQAVQAQNPVALVLGEKWGVAVPEWRPVSVMNPQATGPFRAIPLLATASGRITWLESDRPTDLNKVVHDLQEFQDVRIAKQLSNGRRPVAVVVSEGAIGRVAVIGNGLLFTDALARQNQDSDPITFDLLNATIDWLRDRPTVAVGVEAKKYKEYTFPLGADAMRGLWLPLAFTMLLVVGAGAGVRVLGESPSQSIAGLADPGRATIEGDSGAGRVTPVLTDLSWLA